MKHDAGREPIDLLAARAPACGRHGRLGACPILDGTLIAIDRVAAFRDLCHP